MKLLHTSDWHVGKQIRGRSRADEHRAVLAEIVSVAERESVDVVLVVGDLFEHAAPTPDSDEIVYRTLLDLAATGARVVVVTGNHDNARRFDAVSPVFAAAGVDVLAHPRPPDGGGCRTITVASGETGTYPAASSRPEMRSESWTFIWHP